jgi:hypothetical protein
MFEQFYSKGKPVENRWYGITAYYSNVPIEYLNQFRSAYPGVYKIRYRGPRKNDVGRTFYTKQSSCLKQNAETFSAYSY